MRAATGRSPEAGRSGFDGVVAAAGFSGCRSIATLRYRPVSYRRRRVSPSARGSTGAPGVRVIALATSGLPGSAPSTTTSRRTERGPASTRTSISTRGSFGVDLRRNGRTRLQKPRPPETDLDLIETGGELRHLITHAGHDTQDFAYLRLGKPAGALEDRLARQRTAGLRAPRRAP